MGNRGLVFRSRIAPSFGAISLCGNGLCSFTRWFDRILGLYLWPCRTAHVRSGRHVSGHILDHHSNRPDPAVDLLTRYDPTWRPTLVRVLCVCLGNICRSPAAEGALRARGINVDSAGTGGWHVDEPPYGPMQTAAEQRDMDLSTLRARQFTVADFDNFDLILAMDAQNLADIERLRPKNSTTPVQLFAKTDVPDPYYTRDFAGVLSLIEAAADRLLATGKVIPRTTS